MQPVFGQRSRWDTFTTDGERAGSDAWRVWSAPFRVRGSDLPPLIGVAASGTLLAAFDEPVQRWMQQTQDEFPVSLLKPFREHSPISKAGRTYVLVPLSVAFYVTGLATKEADLREAGIGCLTSNLSTTLPRASGSRLIGRRRPVGAEGPYTFKPFTFNDWSYYSFPGGHVGNITSCVSFWTHRFDLGLAEPALWVLASAIGMGRIVDGAHWPSDTWLGIVLGWAVGKLVAERVADRRVADETALLQQLQQSPQPMYIGWRISF